MALDQEKSPALCELCGELMPTGEEMFKFHGYSGPCPKPPLERLAATNLPDDVLLRFWQSVHGPQAGLTGPLIRFAGLVYREATGIAMRERIDHET